MYNTAFENLSNLRNEYDKAEKWKKRRTIILEAVTLFGMFGLAFMALIMFA